MDYFCEFSFVVVQILVGIPSTFAGMEYLLRYW